MAATNNNTSALRALIEREAETKRARDCAIARIAKLKKSVVQYERDLDELNSAIARQTPNTSGEIRRLDGSGLGKITGKNKKLYDVWFAILRVFYQTYMPPDRSVPLSTIFEEAGRSMPSLREKGIAQRQLYAEACRSVPELKESTFRSHLYRLREGEKFLDKRSGKWFLTDKALEQLKEEKYLSSEKTG